MAGVFSCSKNEKFTATSQDLSSLAKDFPSLATTFTIGILVGKKIYWLEKNILVGGLDDRGSQL